MIQLYSDIKPSVEKLTADNPNVQFRVIDEGQKIYYAWMKIPLLQKEREAVLKYSFQQTGEDTWEYCITNIDHPAVPNNPNIVRCFFEKYGMLKKSNLWANTFTSQEIRYIDPKPLFPIPI